MMIEAPKRSAERPSLTPLIDVVFLLLIFFLLTSALASDRFKVELPKSESSGNPDEESIVVLVGPNDDIAVANQLIPREQLAEHLLRHAGGEELAGRAKLLIKADGAADADDVLDIIEACKQIGLRRVSIATVPQ